MNVHTKAKPFVCGINGCQETFRQRGKLCLHRMTHKEYKKKEYRVFARKSRGAKRLSKTEAPQCPSTGPSSPMSAHASQPITWEAVKPEPRNPYDLSQYCLCEVDLIRLNLEFQARQQFHLQKNAMTTVTKHPQLVAPFPSPFVGHHTLFPVS